MTNLLPCPLCGRKVSIARTENEVGERWWFITRGAYNTTRCNCRLFLESEKFTCDWNADYALECRAKLIGRWNTRAERTCKREKHGTKMDGSPKLRCSLCGYGIGDKRWGYCPKCGAKAVEE